MKRKMYSKKRSGEKCVFYVSIASFLSEQTAISVVVRNHVYRFSIQLYVVRVLSLGASVNFGDDQ